MQKIVPKLWVFFFLIVVVLVVAIVMGDPSSPTTTQTQTDAPETTRYATFEEMLEGGGNAIYVENQTAGSEAVLVGFAILSQPGFIVVYTDNGGVPGSVVGKSTLLESGGEHLVVELDEPLVEDQVYYAMLYHDDGDGRFREEGDTQAVDSQQAVILMSFVATPGSNPETGSIQP